MNFESASIVAVIIGAAMLLASMVYALVRTLSIQARLKRISNSPAFIAASELPQAGERISAGIEKLQAASDRWDGLSERLTAARDASTRLQSGIDSVAACVIDLLETFAPSQRGTASE